VFPDTVPVAVARQVPVLAGQTKAEAAIFHTWLADHGREYERVSTNVRLGTGYDPGEQFPDYARQYTILTTQKRADLVAFKQASVDIWELKITAHLSALGQLLGYRSLWLREFPTWPVDTMGVMAMHMSVDTWTVLHEHGIVIVLYPDVILPALPALPPG